MKEQIKAKMLLLLGEGEVSPLLALFAERSLEMVQAYCNRTDLPPELENVCAELGLALYKREQGEGTDLKRLQEGKISVEFFPETGEEKITRWQDELNRFRKVGW